MDRESCIKQILKCIPDKDVRNYIFNNDNKRPNSFLTNATYVPIYYSNVLNLMFKFLYGKYKIWRLYDSVIDDMKKGINNFKRLLNNFESLYFRKNLTYDLVEFTLMDLQIDRIIGGITSDELCLESDFRTNNKLPKYMYAAKMARQSYRNNDVKPDIDVYLNDLIDLIKTFPVLRNMSFEFESISEAYVANDENDGLVPVTRLSNVALKVDYSFRPSCSYEDESEFNPLLHSEELLVPLDYSFICDNKKQFYILEKFEYDTENGKMMIFNYNKSGSFNKSIKIEVANESVEEFTLHENNQYDSAFYILSDVSVDNLSAIFLTDENALSDVTADSQIIKDFYSINYRYLKMLAIAISDVIGIKEKMLLIKTFHDKYPFFMPANVENNEVDNNWDSTIAMLLIEEGASDTIKVLIKDADSMLYYNLLRNLEVRLGQEKFKATLISDKLNASFKIAIREYSNESFASHSATSGTNNRSNAYLLNSSLIKSEICATLIVSEVSKALNCEAINTNMLKFPSNIRSKIMYVRSIIDDEDDWRNNFYNVSRMFQQTVKVMLCFYNGFFEYAKVKQKYEAHALQEDIMRETVNDYQRTANTLFKQAIHKESTQLDNIKQDNISLLVERLIQLGKDCTDDPERLLILKSCLGRNLLLDSREFLYFKHFNEADIRCYAEFKKFCNNIIDALLYMQSGKSRFKSVSDGLIYPCIATFEYSSLTKDKCNIDHFSTINASGVEVEIKVLSEFDYNLNERYLCIYNAMRTNQKLNMWIEPIIINYNNLVVSQFTFRKIEENDNLDRVIELLYTADDIIYRDLFGSLENAKILLRGLLFNPSSSFYKDNYSVVEKSGQIVGISSNFNNQVKWDKNIIYAEMLANSMEIPDAFDAIEPYFDKLYNYIAIGVNVCNISVHESYRRQGVGRYMIENIISMAGTNDIILTVLDDNLPAINLYEKLGFNIINKFEDYAGANETAISCTMYRKSLIV